MGVNPLEIKKKGDEESQANESRSNSNKTFKPLDPHRIIKAGNVDP